MKKQQKKKSKKKRIFVKEIEDQILSFYKKTKDSVVKTYHKVIKEEKYIQKMLKKAQEIFKNASWKKLIIGCAILALEIILLLIAAGLYGVPMGALYGWMGPGVGILYITVRVIETVLGSRFLAPFILNITTGGTSILNSIACIALLGTGKIVLTGIIPVPLFFIILLIAGFAAAVLLCKQQLDLEEGFGTLHKLLFKDFEDETVCCPDPLLDNSGL